jgi:hypothetical protein
MAERVLFVELGIDATNDDILEQMRIMKRAREERRYDNVFCCIRGFDQDPRELYDIPEVQFFSRRLVSLGFVSYLDFSTLFNPEVPEIAKRFWGASEVLLCSEGRMKATIPVTKEMLEELYKAVVGSNKVADAALGPIVPSELDFDLAALDKPGFKEDAVREDIIAPILRKAGYRATGPVRMERSKPLVHPFVMIGSKKHRVNIIPDYTLYEESVALLVLDAKAPNEPIVRSKHVEQAFSYAIHPEVRCEHYALCNGRQLTFYHVSKSAPLFLIDCKDVLARWEEVEKYLLPRYLKMPALREFHPDFGLQVEAMVFTSNDDFLFKGCLLQLTNKATESLYVSQSTCAIGAKEFMISFDFGQDVLDAILNALPESQSVQIRTALARMPYSIDLDAKVRVHWRAHLGETTQAPYETFIPMVVTELLNTEFDPSLTVGARDPAAIQAGVVQLKA